MSPLAARHVAAWLAGLAAQDCVSVSTCLGCLALVASMDMLCCETIQVMPPMPNAHNTTSPLRREKSKDIEVDLWRFVVPPQEAAAAEARGRRQHQQRQGQEQWRAAEGEDEEGDGDDGDEEEDESDTE